MKQTIGVIFGGQSTEHDISIITALAAIIRPLNLTAKYNVVPIYIAKDGLWYSDDKLNDIKLFSSGKIDTFLQSAKPVAIELGKGLTLVKPGFRPTRITIDIAFPAMHGTYGEDGSLMGVLRMANIPFVGCDQTASAVAMDKVLCKQVAAANGVPVAKSIHFSKKEATTELDSILERARDLQMPLFVKPAHLGSSIGISRVTSHDQLANAIEVAAHYDDLILVEEAVQNLIEVTVPVIGNDDPQAAMVEAPAAKPDEFFDFETKYIREGGKKTGGTKGAQGYSQIPAELPGDLYDVATRTALDVYKAVGCSGIARVDLLIDTEAKVVYFNELNPLPGSLYAHNWQRAGVPPVELVEKLIGYANERFESKKELEATFSTSFLKQF